MRKIYLILGGDDIEIARANSITEAMRIARSKLGVAIGSKAAMNALSHGLSAWVHASRVDGCASLQIMPSNHG